MKTPEERKDFLQKLRLAASETDDLLTSCDASDLLDGLEVARDFMFEAACLIDQLESRLAQVERERDAAVRDMEALAINYESNFVCDFCGGTPPLICEQCKIDYCGFRWRGVCEENTKEPTA